MTEQRYKAVLAVIADGKSVTEGELLGVGVGSQETDREHALLPGVERIEVRSIPGSTRTEAPMAKRPEGKTALVTGATSNIGQAIAFVSEGAHVGVSRRSVDMPYAIRGSER